MASLYNSTFEKYVRGEFMDNVSKRVPFFNWLRKSKAMAPWNGNGKYVEEPVLTKIPDMMQALDPYEQINLRPVDGEELVKFNLKELVYPITITFREMKANKGREQAIDLLKTKMKQAQLAFANAMSLMLLGDGTAQNGKVMLGLEAILPDDNTAGSLGGHDRATNTWLRCPTVTGAKSATAFDNLIAKMRNIKNTCSYGSMVPDIYITTQDVFEGYEALMYGKFMPTTKDESKDLGFGNSLSYAGKPVVFGDNIKAGSMYALSSESLKLRVEGIKSSSDSPFKLEGPFNLMPNQKAYVWLLSVAGALTCNMFRQSGKIKNIS